MNAPIDQLAEQAIEADASDIFLCEGQTPRLRINNRIQTYGTSLISKESLAAFWKSCQANPDTTLEKDTSHILSNGRRLRVNLYKSLGQLSAVLRPIKHEIPSMAELGAPQELLSDWLSRPSGLLLVTGPTGSGKSTTLASALEWVNQHQTKHIVTIEDPIEYLFTNQLSYFSQRELHADTPSFASALRASLRQSPDVIFVGEIRDEETARICIQAAETGHLVLATLHSSGVVDSLERLTHLIQPDQQTGLLKLLSIHLIGILSQQLLPRPDHGLLLAYEHLQNEAATRSWIETGQMTEIADHMNRDDNRANCSFVRFMVAAVQQGFLETGVARQASHSSQDFDRLMRGIN